ncbi:hypothetical protein BpHYR1_034177 [Brachionus plicatilis]|uniref:Uncharacterized protein n=1 Tax=Brachionus plicatilis TaxID=10195 RepID=A0A3M7QKT9_BRAPC|nr:hypothetical protein BpHYR1_034177 [Brachionus plicatilis]
MVHLKRISVFFEDNFFERLGNEGKDKTRFLFELSRISVSYFIEVELIEKPEHMENMMSGSSSLNANKCTCTISSRGT